MIAGVRVTNQPCQVIGRYPYPIRFGPNQLLKVSSISQAYTSGFATHVGQSVVSKYEITISLIGTTIKSRLLCTYDQEQ